MKSILLSFTIVSLLALSGNAQIGIGTTSPDASAVLDMTSTSQGVLIPRMTTTQRDAITTPAIGLQVYDTDSKSIWSYNGASWVNGTGGPGKFVDGATSEIAYYEGRVGIGRDNFTTAHKLWVEEIRSTDGTNTPILVNAEYTGTGTSTATYGVGATVTNSGTGTVDFGIATSGVVTNNAGGSMTNAYGSFPRVVNSGAVTTAVGAWPSVTNSGTAIYAAGAIADVYNNGTATTTLGLNTGVNNSAGNSINQAYGSYMYINNPGTLTSAYGLYIDYYDFANTGTVTNSYGLYLSAGYNDGITNNYAVYSASVANSYVAGSIGVGILDPIQKVHISGAMRLEPQATPPMNGALGDLYADTDGKLYFHDGSGWRQVQLI